MAAFKREYGTAIITDPDAPTIEMKTITCCHCQTVVHIGVPDDTALILFRDGVNGPNGGYGYCRQCDKFTCGPCATKAVCVPFELRLLREEGKKAFYRGIEWLGD